MVGFVLLQTARGAESDISDHVKRAAVSVSASRVEPALFVGSVITLVRARMCTPHAAKMADVGFGFQAKVK